MAPVYEGIISNTYEDLCLYPGPLGSTIGTFSLLDMDSYTSIDCGEESATSISRLADIKWHTEKYVQQCNIFMPKPKWHSIIDQINGVFEV